jgi:ketosteroid isomerase-like protein
MLCWLQNDEPEPRSVQMSAEQNMAAFRRIIEDGFGRGDLAVVDEIVDAACVEHQPGFEPPDREGVKNGIRYLHRAFPDFSMTLEHVTADGDLVWGHARARGTHTGSLGHIPPTGKRMAIDVIDLCRFRDGKIVEHWGVPDRLSQLQQLGLVPEPRPAAKA